jgi:putative tricarboxylic transport membrane protein
VAPAIIGLILGPLAEQQMRRALSISQGDFMVFLQEPISAVLLALSAIVLFGPMLWRAIYRKPAGQPR